jgi:hypothetical protein
VRAQEAAADMRARLEAITGPAGPQARARQLESQIAQLARRLEAADGAAADARRGREAAAAALAAKEEEVIGLEGQLAVVQEELAETRRELGALQQRTPRGGAGAGAGSAGPGSLAATPRGGGGDGGSSLGATPRGAPPVRRPAGGARSGRW